MRRAAIVLSLAVVVNAVAVGPAAASLVPAGTPAAATPVATADPALAARFFDLSFNQGNPTAAGLLTPDFVFHLVGRPDMHAGAFAAFVGELRAAFPDLQIGVQTAFAQGDRVAARWALRGTQEGPYPGIPATHKAVVGVPGHAIFRVAGAEVAEAWAIVGEVGLLQQLGAWPGPADPAAAGPPSPTPGAPPDGDTMGLVARLSAAADAGDTATVDQLLAADFVAHPRGGPPPGTSRLNHSASRRPPARGATAPGRAGFHQNDDAWRAIFPDSRSVIEDVVAAGDLVMVRVTTTATQRGAFGPIPPTGKTVTFAAMGLWRVRNGQLVDTWTVWDHLGLVQQLRGVATPPADAEVGA
jgi:steroid delta-isomerase-like uncharacterized protein